MTLGIPLHTHGDVQGVTAPTILKVLAPDEWPHPRLPPEQCVIHQGAELVAPDSGDVVARMLRRDDVVASGDVIRLRRGSGAISVLWRRGARANFLFATERCNSLCLMCSQPPREVDDAWRVEELLQLIPLIDPAAAQLGITGGEPTLLGSGLTKVLASCREHLPETRLHVLTNGRRFQESGCAAEWIAAGGSLTTWAVPLYADHAALHDEVVDSPGAFEETLSGLYELACRDAAVEIRVVLHRLTIPRLRHLAVFLFRRMPFVRHIALMGLEPMGFAKGNRERLWIDPVDYVRELEDAMFYLANRGLSVSIYNLPLCILPEGLRPFARQSISEWKNAFAPECGACGLRSRCAGFFASAGPAWRSRAIRPIMREESYEVA
jgi:His-Xaa-Ser system radical SAM maturase HxsC